MHLCKNAKSLISNYLSLARKVTGYKIQMQQGQCNTFQLQCFQYIIVMFGIISEMFLISFLTWQSRADVRYESAIFIRIRCFYWRYFKKWEYKLKLTNVLRRNKTRLVVSLFDATWLILACQYRTWGWSCIILKFPRYKVIGYVTYIS